MGRRSPRAALAALAALALLAAACTTAGGEGGGTTGTGPGPASTTTSLVSVQPVLAQVVLFDPGHGVGLFQRTGPGGCRDLVGSTGDGGATFTSLVPAAACAQGGRLAFDPAGDGFLYGPGLVETHDGGRTWDPVAHPGTVLSVGVVGRTAWLVTAACPGGSARPATCPLQVEISTDGGRSWTPSASQPPGAVAGAGAVRAAPSSGQTWLVRTGPAAAYVVSDPEPVHHAPDDAPVWFTTDGGRHWTPHFVPCGLPARTVALSADPGGALLAVCATRAAAGGEEDKATAVSLDGGTTWALHQPCGPPVSIPCAATTPLERGDLGSLTAVSSTTAFLVGPGGDLLVTRDGGATWRAVHGVGDPSGPSPSETVFFDPRDGAVLGRAATRGAPVTLWHTADGGRTWTAVTPRTPS
jgi:photosystem II stability/assembly factor-like uncharacterized protein